MTRLVIASLPKLSLAGVALLALGADVRAADVPAAPLLQIETGMHTAVVKSIAADREGRFLVTASDDKTLRLWDAKDWTLLRTWRPPQGPGKEGMLYAAAITPDGATLAAGGVTVSRGEEESVYLIERSSGLLLRRLRGLPNVVLRLVFSPDGQRLAACLSAGGLRVFRVADGKELRRDEDYQGTCYGADFDPQGRLVTASLDGHLRLYDANLQLLRKRATLAGKQPYRVRFSPDGQSVAVGFSDVPIAAKHRAADLAPLPGLDLTGVGNGHLGSVAWSADGRTLCAAGTWRVWTEMTARCWSDAGGYKDLRLPGDTVLELTALLSGRLAFASAAPSWGIFDPGGPLRLHRESPNAYLQPQHLGSFRLDRSGGQVAFTYDYEGTTPVRFSLAQRQLRLAPTADGTLQPPRRTAPGLVLFDWRDSTAVSLNGQPLPLEPYETSRSLAIAADGGAFLLGTEWWLRFYRRDGALFWQAPAPGPAWAVNLSADGRVAVAAHGDGTLRWYRVSDGRLLLTVFLHADRRRFVAYTPAGYYDASPEAEDLIGWLLNQGRDAPADFYPASQLRKKFHRPDLVARALEDPAPDDLNPLEPTALRRLLETELPPLVQIMAPSADAQLRERLVRFSFLLRSPGQVPVTRLRADIDDQPVLDLGLPPAPFPKGVTELPLEVRFLVPARDSKLTVRVASARSALSEAATLGLHWAGPAPATQERPALHLLTAGVQDYKDPEIKTFPTLRYAITDAKEAAAAFGALAGPAGLFQRGWSQHLADPDAAALTEALAQLAQQAKDTDLSVIYLAGHGYVKDTPRGGRYAFLPSGARLSNLQGTALSTTMLLESTGDIRGKVLLLLDTCHAGKVGTARGGSALAGLLYEFKEARPGTGILTAAQETQKALEDALWGGGAFTVALTEFLRGEARPGVSTRLTLLAQARERGRYTLKDLDKYLLHRVRELTGSQQSPVSNLAQLDDVPLRLLKK